MYQLTIRLSSGKAETSMTRNPSERIRQIRGVYDAGSVQAIEVTEVCPHCAGTGYVPERNKKRSRAGFSTACKACDKRGFVGDVVTHKGN